jgi:hypothetical protein
MSWLDFLLVLMQFPIFGLIFGTSCCCPLSTDCRDYCTLPTTVDVTLAGIGVSATCPGGECPSLNGTYTLSQIDASLCLYEFDIILPPPPANSCTGTWTLRAQFQVVGAGQFRWRVTIAHVGQTAVWDYTSSSPVCSGTIAASFVSQTPPFYCIYSSASATITV